MRSLSLSDIDFFKVPDIEPTAPHYGCDQGWFNTEIQQRSGCGPTTITNILWYTGAKHPELNLNRSPAGKADLIEFMEDIWQFVTPSKRGIPTTDLLSEPTLKYARANKLHLSRAVLGISPEKATRPPWGKIISYLEKALTNDYPIAFLNLCNGEEAKLDEWHWVTLVALQYDATNATATVIDNGKLKQSDLSLWYHTTTLGGGFVYFPTSPTV